METKTITVEQYINAPPERVFTALTQKEELEKWFVQIAQVDLRPGGEIKTNWTAQMGEHGYVQEVSSPHVFSFTWEGDFSPSPTTLTFTLVPQKEGTLLRLTHSGISQGKGWEAYDTIGNAWPLHLNDLKSWVETGTCPPPGPRG